MVSTNVHLSSSQQAAIALGVLVAVSLVFGVIERPRPRWLGGFIWQALRPFGWITNLVTAVLGIGLLAGAVRVWKWLSLPWAIVVLVSVLALLFLRLGYQLHRATMLASFTRLDVEPSVAPPGRSVRLDGAPFHQPMAVWLHVTNANGPSGTFVATVLKGVHVGGFKVAWENTPDEMQPIARGSSDRILLAMIDRNTQKMWFLLPGTELHPSPSEPASVVKHSPIFDFAGSVDCTVSIMNTTNDQGTDVPLRITRDLNGDPCVVRTDRQEP